MFANRRRLWSGYEAACDLTLSEDRRKYKNPSGKRQAHHTKHAMSNTCGAHEMYLHTSRTPKDSTKPTRHPMPQI